MIKILISLAASALAICFLLILYHIFNIYKEDRAFWKNVNQTLSKETPARRKKIINKLKEKIKQEQKNG